MAESNNEQPINRKLIDIFDEAFDLYNRFDQSYEPTNSDEVQLKVKKCIRLFEDATRLVSLVGMFSKNETYDEISSNDLKYMLLPYFLGQLSLKLCSGERKEIVEVAEIYYKDFLKRCEDYGLHKPTRDIAIRHSEQTGELADLMQMAHQRNAKLEEYRQKKELDDQIKQIKLVMEREHMDYDMQKDFYIKVITSSIMKTQNELQSIAQEKQILEHISKMRQKNPDFDLKKLPKRPSQPLKAIIITKDEMQKAVYGLGYPSVPTMTVAEFYDQRVREGIFPDPNIVRDPNSLQARAMLGDTTQLDLQAEEETESKIENDDEEYLARARAKDEFKDEVRRGDGNRHNRS